MRVNVIYAFMNPAEEHSDEHGRHTFLHSPEPRPGFDIYAFYNASSCRGRIQGVPNVLVIEEPIIVEPQQYDVQVWTQFNHVFTSNDYMPSMDPKNFTYFYTSRGAWESITTEDMAEREAKYPVENRQNAIVMIQGNKHSSFPSELYSKREEAAKWWNDNSSMPFKIFGRPAFNLPNYEGTVDLGPLPRLAKFAEYRYALCFENTDHPQLSKGYHQKIPDCLEVRTVPIYYGCQNIEKYVPKNCFIDFRDFGSFKAVDTYIRGLTEDDYLAYVAAIDHFVCRGGLRPWAWSSLYKEIEHWAFGINDDCIETNGESDVIKKYIKPGDVVFDVGARSGEWSRFAIQRTDEGHLYAFDPNPQTTGIPIFKHALSNHEGLSYYYDTSESLYNRVVGKSRIQETARPVSVTTVDAFCASHSIDRIDFMKIDVEGSEYNVMKGALGMIEDGKIKHIQFEYGGTWSDVGITKQEVFSFLRDRGYDIFKIERGKIVKETEKPFANRERAYAEVPAIKTSPVGKRILGQADFYAQFLKTGDTFFDVGANIGDRTAAALALGAKVLAIEPQPVCVDALYKSLGQNNKVIIFNGGLSDHEGTADLMLCDDVSTISTMSKEWTTEGRFSAEHKWSTTIPVRVTTLDSMIKAYGRPTLVKIDVEGLEYEVLKGLTEPVPYLSFEFAGEFIDNAKKCIDYLLLLGKAQFNVSLEEKCEFLFNDWVDHAELFKKIESFNDPLLWGDIYVTFPEVAPPKDDYQYANYLAIQRPKGVSMESKNETVCVVFSKDRAMQLDGCMRSLYRHCEDVDLMDMRVIWTASSEMFEAQYNGDWPRLEIDFQEEVDFQTDLLSTIEGYKYVMFLTDDTMFVDDFSIKDVILELGFWKESIGLSLRLGWNTKSCYMLNKEQKVPEGQFTYNWTDYEGDFGYPLEISSSIYRVDDLMPLLEQPVYDNPNTLEAYFDWSKGQFKEKYPMLSFYNSSRAFANPLNKVQTIFTGNRSGSDPRFSVEHLADLYDKGYRIDVSKFDDFVPTGVHQEVDLEFIGPDGKAYKEERQPDVSIIMLNFNGGEDVKKAVESVKRTIGNHPYEFLVWDNGSTDGSKEWLGSESRDNERLRVLGFELAENIGVSAREKLIPLAKGKYIVIMDNDVVLTKGWLDKCIFWAQNIPDLGIVCPRTNYASGPQLIDRPAPYLPLNGDYDALEAFAKEWGEAPDHKGQLWQIARTPSFFWFMTRACIERVGNMRHFSTTGFEDEDYTIRCTLAGLRVLIDNGLYIHHTGGPLKTGDERYVKWMAEAWTNFKKAWDLPEDMIYGQTDYISQIVQTVPFDRNKHYIPIEGDLK